MSFPSADHPQESEVYHGRVARGLPSTVLWLRWVLASALGAALTGALEGGLQFIATLVLAGFLMGGAQALVLRPVGGVAALGWMLATGLGVVGANVLHASVLQQWMLATGLGVVGANVLHASVLQQSLGQLALQLWGRYGVWEAWWLSLLNGAFVWGLASCAQLLVLWRGWRSLWWAPTALLGGAFYGIASATACAAACAPVGALAGSSAATALAYGAGGLAYGVISGGVVSWLSAARRSDVSA